MGRTDSGTRAMVSPSGTSRSMPAMKARIISGLARRMMAEQRNMGSPSARPRGSVGLFDPAHGIPDAVLLADRGADLRGPLLHRRIAERARQRVAEPRAVEVLV